MKSATLAGWASGFIASGYLAAISPLVALFLPAVFIWGLSMSCTLSRGRRVQVSWLVGLLVFAFALLLGYGGAGYSDARSVGFLVYQFGPLIGLALVPHRNVFVLLHVHAVSVGVLVVLWLGFVILVQGQAIERWSLTGPAGGPNFYGATLNLVWPVLLWYALLEKQKLYSKAILALAALCFSGVLITHSRSAALAAAIAAIICMISVIRGGKYVLLIVGAVTGVLVLWFANWGEAGAGISATMFRDNRSDIWVAAFEAIKERPLVGHGPGASSFVLQDVGSYHAHNTVFQVWLENGVISAGIMLIISFYLAIMAAQCVREGGLGVGIGAAISSYLVYSAVASPITQPALTLSVVVLVLAARGVLVRESLNNSGYGVSLRKIGRERYRGT